MHEHLITAASHSQNSVVNALHSHAAFWIALCVLAYLLVSSAFSRSGG